MKKEKYVQVLQKDEEVIWAEGVNKGAYFLKNGLTYIIAVGIVAIFISFMYVAISSQTNSNVYFTLDSIFKLFGILFGIGIILSFIGIALVANNIFLAITNKRIIKRSGAFNNRFIHYSLKNIGTCEVVGSIFDKKGKDGSATLIVAVKDFQTNTDGNAFPVTLNVDCLNKVYNAYNVLSEQVDGNNESLRVKLEK